MTSRPRSSSSAAVGSSASSTPGRFISARAMPTRWRSPPERWAGRWPARWPSPTASRSSQRPRAGVAVEAAVDVGDELDLLERGERREQVRRLEHEADRRRPAGGSSRVGRGGGVGAGDDHPPASGRRRRPATASRVDLPEPEAPVTATTSPVATDSEAPSRMVSVSSPSGTVTVIASRTSRGRSRSLLRAERDDGIDGGHPADGDEAAEQAEHDEVAADVRIGPASRLNGTPEPTSWPSPTATPRADRRWRPRGRRRAGRARRGARSRWTRRAPSAGRSGGCAGSSTR